VISCHLWDIGEYLVMIGYIAIVENNHVLRNDRRLGGIVIEKQQGMEVLGAYLSPFVSIKDWFVVHSHVMLNACLSLSWLDKSFRPRSQVAQLRLGTCSVEVRTLWGAGCESKGRPGMNVLAAGLSKGDLRWPLIWLYQRWPKVTINLVCLCLCEE
jgi:hypothetical protein